MFTETELRDALEHSAARADDIDIATPKPPRRSLLPLVAAAAVAALALGVAALVGGTGDKDPAPIGETGPHTRVDLVDRAVAGVDARYGFKDAGIRATGGQTISRAPGTNGTEGAVSVAVLPARFVDEDQIERGEKVAIAGTTGWFAKRTLYELDGQEGAAPGQDDPLPQWTIAFRTPAGDWAFARIDSVTLDPRGDGTYDTITIKDPARIVAAYDGLRIRFVRDSATQPLRFGTLPDGYRLTQASMTVTRGRATDESLTFTRGSERFVVTWSVSSDRVSTGACRTIGAKVSRPPLCFAASRKTNGGMLSIVGSGTVPAGQDADKSAYAARQQRVLKGITVATDPADYVGFEQAVTP